MQVCSSFATFQFQLYTCRIQSFPSQCLFNSSYFEDCVEICLCFCSLRLYFDLFTTIAIFITRMKIA